MSDIIAEFSDSEKYALNVSEQKISSDVNIQSMPLHYVSMDSATYWRQQLNNAPFALQLPYDHLPTKAQAVYRHAYPFVLSEQLLDGLKMLADTERTSLFPILLTAFAVLLNRYTSQDDLLIAIPMKMLEKTSVEAETNISLLRLGLANNPSFIELLEHVSKTMDAAYLHSDFALSSLITELLPHDESGSAHFPQVFCTFQEQDTLPVTVQQTVDILPTATRVSIGLEFYVLSDALQCSITYDANLFEQDTIVRMIEHYHVLLTAITTDAQAHIATLPLLTSTEQQRLLVDWNATRLEYPVDQRITDLFEAQVVRTPDLPALILGDIDEQSISYAELNSRANQLAYYLKRMGVGPEVLVGVYIRRSVEMIVSLLGILKCGGAYVPLDPAYPAERLTFMLRDATISTVLTQKSLVESLPEGIAHVVCLDSDWTTIALEPGENIANPARADNLSYVIYTSGSTGKPKGVAIEHRNTVALIHWALQAFTQEELAGVIASTSINFDVSIFELFVPLSCGGSIILLENVLRVLDLPAHVHATLLCTVPSAATELVYAGKLPASITTINLAGEPLPGPLVQQLYQQTTVQRVYNVYGPTEDTTYSTYALMSSEEYEPSIGHPIANTQVYILDAHLQPVPRGVVGELYLAGAGLARGYLNRPELNAMRFVSASFGGAPEVRMYKTGDLVRYRADGAIAYLGRSDNQVKVRGFRIELEEIEEIIRQQETVREVVVSAWNAPSGSKQLVAYVVPVPGHVLLIDELRRALLQKLPDYMVPEHIITMTALPLAPNGKVDRHSLPTPDAQAQKSVVSVDAPTTLTQYRLLEIWRELLGIERIGITDNFFHLGGSSLLAARLVASIEHTFDKKISLSTLLAHPTVAQVAECLELPEDDAVRFPVVKVQGGSKKPFFYLHGDWTGGAFYCFTLAQAMGPEQPFYAVGPYSYDERSDPLTLEEMAVIYITSFRAIQPEGPYMLSGFCNGGLMTYEIARQLRLQGQEVSLLLLVEPADADYSQGLYIVAHTLRRLFHWRRLQELDLFLRLRHLCKMLQFSSKKKLEDFKYINSIDPRLLRLSPPAEALRKDHVGVFTWATAAYSFPSYSGPITLFWSKQEPFRGIWKRKRDREHNIALHMIPGAHITSITEYARIFAERMSRCVQNVWMDLR